MSKAPERILIVLLGAIGDVVRGLPLLQRLRVAWPQARIAWSVEPPAAPILENHPALDERILFRRKEGVRAFVRFLSKVRAFRADLTLDLQRHFKSGMTSLASAAPRRVGFAWENSREGNYFFNNEHIPPVERFSSKVMQFLRFADHLGLPSAPIEFGLHLTESEQRRVDTLLEDLHKPFAALLLGSTWPSRYWFPDRVAATCRALRQRGLEVVLVGGPADTGFAQEVIAAGAGPIRNTVGRTSLRDVIGILKRAKIAIGVDSGPMHIAAAVGTPVVSLWGSTSPKRSAPYGSENYVIVGDVPCAPCYLRHCPIGRVCMEAIRVDRVLGVVDELLLAQSLPATPMQK